MIRVLYLLLGIGVLATPALAATPFRSQVEIADSVVRLGDVLEAAGDAAAQIIAPAPPPGESATLSAQAIVAAANAAGIEVESQGAGFVTVTRLGQPLPQHDLRERIAKELAQHGAEPPLRIRITNHRGPLYLPIAADRSDLAIESVDYDPRSGRFSSTLALPGDGGIARRVVLSGVAEAERYVPVLARSLGPGDVIGPRDIDWIRMAARQINRTMITDAALLTGREPVRPLRAGVPLRLSEVQAPLLVHKGALVTMIVQRGGLLLTATGKAMQDGARGEIIRLQNTATRRIIEGQVAGPERVDVMLPSTFAAIKPYGETP